MPLLREEREGVKPKCERRGKGFVEGNTKGLATRLKKGMPNANPGGRPRSANLAEAFRKRFAVDAGTKLPIHTRADRVAETTLRKADKGDVRVMEAAGDGAYGKP